MGLLAYTFGTGLAVAVVVAWIVVWVFVAVSVFRRRDLGVVAKLIWIVIILILPIVGLLVYFLWAASTPERR
jgi:hypothetical protein